MAEKDEYKGKVVLLLNEPATYMNGKIINIEGAEQLGINNFLE